MGGRYIEFNKFRRKKFVVQEETPVWKDNTDIVLSAPAPPALPTTMMNVLMEEIIYSWFSFGLWNL